MKQLARRYVYWKFIDKHVKRVVRECAVRALLRCRPPKAPLNPSEIPENNCQRIHVDYAEPFHNHNFLVVMDAKSKRVEMEVCYSGPTSTSTIEMIQNVFARYGYPDVMVSYNDAIFTIENLQKF
ncbi:uncharacterized protein K02A2.6-like [Homalodisca vitripennis]|uniref:uncharacterized protein K02A2.6-like n=1 Tax=Homalodisca vitripennis TaxID=197043 RepID=UPI001EEB993C|nr:uncharacterized protein K02A2.6-like [Homalodisca vitripennis]